MPNRPDWQVRLEPPFGPQSGSRTATAGITIDARYRVVDVLGSGAMGVVYRAEDVWLGRLVAVKVIEPGQSRDERAVERFKKEAQTLAQVRHENVVQVYTFGPHETSFYLAMEYVDGRGLDAIIEERTRRGELTLRDEALGIIRQLALGLAACHRRNIVHRDVKPSNVVIENETGRPVLVDFGLARRRSTSQAKQSMAGGTPCYMPPEQASDVDGTRTGPPADVYALACTAFEIFAGRPVFESDSAIEVLSAHMRDVPPLLSSFRPELRPFDRVIARALAKKPEDRYPTCQELVADLDLAARRLGTPFPPVPTTGIRRRVRVLVLEQDDALRRQLVRTIDRVFRGAGDAVDVECFAYADPFLAAFERHPADIVIVDDEHSGSEGIEIMRAIRAVKGGAGAEAVLLSRHWVRSSSLLAEVRARELPKPISSQALVSVLTKLGAELAQRAARTETL